MYRRYGSESRTLTINVLGGASTVFNTLFVITHLGHYDILNGEQPFSKSGENVKIAASIVNNGDLEEVCAILCEYPLGIELWSWSDLLAPGMSSGAISSVIGQNSPFIMPTTNATVRISCSP